jgi:hypothetical protein
LMISLGFDMAHLNARQASIPRRQIGKDAMRRHIVSALRGARIGPVRCSRADDTGRAISRFRSSRVQIAWPGARLAQPFHTPQHTLSPE